MIEQQNNRNGIADQVSEARKSEQLSASSVEDIKNTLLNIFTKIGLQNYPTEVEDQILFNFIRTKIKNLTINEFVLAFDLALIGEIKVDLKTYGGTFSVKYMCDVINAYRAFIRPLALYSKNTLSEKTQLTDDEKDRIVRKGILYSFDYFKKHGRLPIGGHVNSYNFLRDLALIPEPDDAYLEKVKKKAENQLTLTLNERKDKVMDGELDEIIKRLQVIGEDNEIIVVMKEIMLIDYFNLVTELQL